MPGSRILKDDWKDYDKHKTRDNRDRSKFLCEQWEIRYLVSKIKTLYPQFSETDVTNAISECCRTVLAPRHRTDFVDCVMKRLRQGPVQ